MRILFCLKRDTAVFPRRQHLINRIELRRFKVELLRLVCEVKHNKRTLARLVLPYAVKHIRNITVDHLIGSFLRKDITYDKVHTRLTALHYAGIQQLAVKQKIAVGIIELRRGTDKVISLL